MNSSHKCNVFTWIWPAGGSLSWCLLHKNCSPTFSHPSPLRRYFSITSIGTHRIIAFSLSPEKQRYLLINSKLISQGGQFVFCYLEALSLASNELQSLVDLQKIKHLPLLMELDVSFNLVEELDEGKLITSMHTFTFRHTVILQLRQ